MASIDSLIDGALEAGERFARLDQGATDRIVAAACEAACAKRDELGTEAAEETGAGVAEHKSLKNFFASRIVFEHISSQKTAGIISQDLENGVTEIARPVGPVLGMTPVTNPTSTAIFKSLICLKTRNPLIISPHKAARHCTTHAAAICYEAALGAGAPENCIQVLEKASPDTLQQLMNHPGLSLILVTGTGKLVRAVSSCATPSIGVGPGNVPALITTSAEVKAAARAIFESKTFDNGTVCASEQAIVSVLEKTGQFKSEMSSLGTYFLSREETDRLSDLAWDPQNATMSAAVVGLPAQVIARKAGFTVPEGTRLLAAELPEVGPAWPLSAEILAPVIAFYSCPDFEQALVRCRQIVSFGGTGHTASIFSTDDSEIRRFAEAVPAGRILVNQGGTFGALGGMTNRLQPSLTLACGPRAGNLFLDNIGTRHLLSISRIALERPNPAWLNR